MHSCVFGDPTAASIMLMTLGFPFKIRISAHFPLDQMGLTPAVWQPGEPNTNISVGGSQYNPGTGRQPSCVNM